MFFLSLSLCLHLPLILYNLPEKSSGSIWSVNLPLLSYFFSYTGRRALPQASTYSNYLFLRQELEVESNRIMDSPKVCHRTSVRLCKTCKQRQKVNQLLLEAWIYFQKCGPLIHLVLFCSNQNSWILLDVHPDHPPEKKYEKPATLPCFHHVLWPGWPCQAHPPEVSPVECWWHPPVVGDFPIYSLLKQMKPVLIHRSARLVDSSPTSF